MSKLILLRHGQSEWNRKNLFTGWVDVPLSAQGIEEAVQAGKALTSVPVDVIFTSTLGRAQMTAALALMSHESGKVARVVHDEPWYELCDTQALERTVPVYVAWQLNERMYGELQGLNKDEIRRRFGVDQVQKWRRSFDEAPPGGESLKMTAARTIPYFKEKVMPFLEQGKNVWISAHGNSLRALVMFIKGLQENEVMELEIATGVPLAYTWTAQGWAYA